MWGLSILPENHQLTISVFGGNDITVFKPDMICLFTWGTCSKQLVYSADAVVSQHGCVPLAKGRWANKSCITYHIAEPWVRIKAPRAGEGWLAAPGRSRT